MIRTLDISNWGSPYSAGAFSWDLVAGGWEKLQQQGLAGGTLVGNVLGLGADELTTPTGPLEQVTTCDFSQGDLVLHIQEQLGVSQTGVFDAATCAAWRAAGGSPSPSAEELALTTDRPCSVVIEPGCPRQLNLGAVLGLTVFAGAAALLLIGGKR